MKCPKCGFTSFDYLDSCRQCNADLAETRKKLGLETMPASEPETLLGPAVAESGSLSDDGDFTFQEPEAESSEDLVFSDSDLFEESDLGFSTEQLELGVADASAPLEGGQSGSGDLGPIDFDFEESGPGEPLAGEPSPLGAPPSAGLTPPEGKGLSEEEFELSDTEPAALSDLPEDSAQGSRLPPPGESNAFSLNMDDLLDESSGLEEADLELTSIDEDDLSLDDLDEFELLDEDELLDETEGGGTVPNAKEPERQKESLAEDLEQWKLEDALDLTDDELLDAIPDLESEDK